MTAWTDPQAAGLMRLRAALEHLSWPATRQREYLTKLGVAPSIDELALEFDDALRPISSQFDDLCLPVEVRELLTEIDKLLSDLSGSAVIPPSQHALVTHLPLVGQKADGLHAPSGPRSTPKSRTTPAPVGLIVVMIELAVDVIGCCSY
jgi:hypothetical protein